MTRLKQLEKKHKLYPGFVKWLRAHSKVKAKDTTLAIKLDTLQRLRRFGFDPGKNPDVAMILTNAGKTHSAASLNLDRIVLNAWLKYKEIEITEDMEAELKSKSGDRKREIRKKDLLTPDELKDIVAHTHSPALRAFYMTLWDLGCRPNAICAANIADVTEDEHGFVFFLNDSKNAQSRKSVRMLEPEAIQHFQYYWAMHPNREDPEAALFLNQSGRRLKANTVIHSLKHHEKRLGRGTGNGKAPLNLYLFRKSRATYLLTEGKLSETEIKIRMGHKRDSKVLEKYYDIRDEGDQADAELGYIGATSGQDTRTIFVCPNCGVPNEEGKKRCFRCKHPFTSEAIAEGQGVIDELKERLNKLEERENRWMEMSTWATPEVVDRMEIVLKEFWEKEAKAAKKKKGSSKKTDKIFK